MKNTRNNFLRSIRRRLQQLGIDVPYRELWSVAERYLDGEPFTREAARELIEYFSDIYGPNPGNVPPIQGVPMNWTTTTSTNSSLPFVNPTETITEEKKKRKVDRNSMFRKSIVGKPFRNPKYRKP